MPIYEFRCDAGHVVERVRPIGTEAAASDCGAPAERIHGAYRHEPYYPPLDDDGRVRRFREAAGALLDRRAERRRNGDPAEHEPNMVAMAERIAWDRMRHGEVDVADVKRRIEMTGLGRKR